MALKIQIFFSQKGKGVFPKDYELQSEYESEDYSSSFVELLNQESLPEGAVIVLNGDAFLKISTGFFERIP